MRREDLEHLVMAAATVSEEVEVVVIGSQAVLGTFADAPEAMLRSQEADVYPRHAPEKAEAIDGALGDGSRFHEAFGYFAHGVGPETAKAPLGWEDRLVAIEIPPRAGSTQMATALCLEVHDLVLAKCAFGRDRDWDFAREAVRAKLVSPGELESRVSDLPLGQAELAHVRQMLSATIAVARRGSSSR
jgi:hypothetical protein